MLQQNPEPNGYAGARILVTGGLGFIGCSTVRALASQDCSVMVLDDGFTGQTENVAGLPNVEVVMGSVVDPETVRSAMQGADYVFHLSCRNIIVSTSDPAMDCQVNTVGTVNVLLSARDAGVRRVVYASSASVYGNPHRIPAAEDDPVSLLSPYAASKFAGEGFCQAYYESFGLPVTVLRYSNVYGPMQRPDNPYCGVVSRFMDAALHGKPLRIFGDGEQTRDFTYIEDVVAANLLAGLSPRAEGHVYNISTGREVSVNRLAELVARTSGCQPEVAFAPRRDIDTIRRRVLSAERIRRDLRWSAVVPLEEGLSRTFTWLRGR